MVLLHLFGLDAIRWIAEIDGAAGVYDNIVGAVEFFAFECIDKDLRLAADIGDGYAAISVLAGDELAVVVDG